MPVTEKGVFSPGDNDDWDLVIDLATMAASIDMAIENHPQNYLIDTATNRPAPGVRGRTFFATDTGQSFFDDGTAWKNRTRARAQLTSSTGSVNGNATLAWTDVLADFSYEHGGDFWSASQPTRIALPYAGAYRISYNFRIQGVTPITVTPTRFGSVSGTVPYGSSSGTGVSGAATSGGRMFDITNCAPGDYLAFTIASTAASNGSHNIVIEYLGEF